ncbi:hypothetical protein [Pseudodesulfovibrio sp.]|uniref:hypothetical protein n=1 Tax=unclassified Pseudodesulfovibrio TaxID=2661612 RepID=UPI003B0039B8
MIQLLHRIIVRLSPIIDDSRENQDQADVVRNLMYYVGLIEELVFESSYSMSQIRNQVVPRRALLGSEDGLSQVEFLCSGGVVVLTGKKRNRDMKGDARRCTVERSDEQSGCALKSLNCLSVGSVVFCGNICATTNTGRNPLLAFRDCATTPG